VFALRWRQGSKARPAYPDPSFSFGHFVLPRWLRRPVRMFGRLGEDELAPPRYAMSVLSVVLLGSSLAYGGYLGGHLDSFVQGVTARTGFAVDQIKVVGNRETSEIDVLDRLELDGWTSLVGFDAAAARKRIETLPWIEAAAVRKVYPHGLEVRIEERQPFAIWQQGRELSVIEKDGRIIAPYAGGKEAGLPLIIGAGAPENAPGLMARLAQYPGLTARVKGYVRVGERRWDLKLENGITVKLPEEGEDRAIADLVRMDRDNGLLARDIVAVDMRIAGQLAVQLSPEAMDARLAALKQKPRTMKRKPEAKI
jgi:cell division protein FtsQ